MSNEQFRNEYDGRKIFIQKNDKDEQDPAKGHRGKYMSPSPAKKFGPQGQNLNGLVKIKAYDNQVTDELPLMQCNLLPTQLDHVKLLICEQEDKNYPKLTLDASTRFELEKQNQIKQYMEDIIVKLQ